LTAWLALDPATRASGAVQVIPGTHKQLIGDWRRNVEADLEASGLLEGLGPRVFLEAQPGEFWLFHSWLLHGSDANRSTARRAGLNMRFCMRGDEAQSEFEYLPVQGSALRAP
jgi:ectoine hydroxylase-related dioxygenase (phytanoyl-CoA dioxygenase family)